MVFIFLHRSFCCRMFTFSDIEVWQSQSLRETNCIRITDSVSLLFIRLLREKNCHWKYPLQEFSFFPKRALWDILETLLSKKWLLKKFVNLNILNPELSHHITLLKITIDFCCILFLCFMQSISWNSTEPTQFAQWPGKQTTSKKTIPMERQ